ncbi:nitroreductase family deazaflavin-dependent oxidoreductase [Micromonospora sp. NPDC049679]|uniref:nitroreductase family deazaflavin-dependent oxidoreductase n=1 Tax=Micromonospora sp. NPDC049679 TaxID=3155920 RepID=UPI0034014611
MTQLPSDVQAYNRKLIEEFRAAGEAPDGRPLLLLTTVGARTGQQRTTPLMYVPDGDRLLVFASAAGAVRHPDWYYNLVADPRVTVEVGGESYQGRAVVLAGEERDRLFARTVQQFPFFADHQAGVTRQIPVVALVRA